MHRILIFMLACVGLPAALVAQTPANWDAGKLQLSRPELEELLKRFEQTAASGSHSATFRERAKAEADLVRRRLTDGDFQVGDQIELMIEGEKDMPLKLTVGPGRVLTIPNLGELALTGVLRSELNAKAHEHLARLIREPVVRTRSLVRVAVLGQVGRPGFYIQPAEATITEVIMAAGGPGTNASLDKVEIIRGPDRIWEGNVLQEAIASGRTLDQMSLRSGDQVMIPEKRGRSLLSWSVIPGAILGILSVVRMLQ